MVNHMNHHSNTFQKIRSFCCHQTLSWAVWDNWSEHCNSEYHCNKPLEGLLVRDNRALEMETSPGHMLLHSIPQYTVSIVFLNCPNLVIQKVQRHSTGFCLQTQKCNLLKLDFLCYCSAQFQLFYNRVSDASMLFCFIWEFAYTSTKGSVV